MSCYNYEKGTIKIPAKEWARFRREFVEDWNARLLRRYERSKSLNKALREHVKGKRGLAREEAISQWLARYLPVGNLENEELRESIVETKRAPGRMRFEIKKVPLKKDLKLLSKKGGPFTVHLEDASVSFDDNRTMTWRVHENNRAVERSRKHPVARSLFARLNRMNWTRGSGGKIYGNDEYNIEAGNGDYISRSFG